MGESHPIRRTVYGRSLEELVAAAVAALTEAGDELELHVFVVEDRFSPPDSVLEIQVLEASQFDVPGRYLSNFELPQARLVVVGSAIVHCENVEQRCTSSARTEAIVQDPLDSPTGLLNQKTQPCVLVEGHGGRHSTASTSRTSSSELWAWQWD
jgi:hypothetical protein